MKKRLSPKLDVSTDAEAVKEVKNFKACKQIAMSIIYLNIDSSHRRIVERIDDPVEAWEVLKTYYQPDSKAHHHGVQTILRLDNVKFVYKDVVAKLVAEEARLKLRNMDMNKKNCCPVYQNGVKEKEHKNLLSVQESRSPEKQTVQS
ncbi:hypothetical protein TNCT_68751 [Trichonephila clavata]|uniref:Polyprotein n=1 Tax=Trichonephila clavata TaxID=2740835 RepID=A0A8X6GC48_TRICU|nr:hypothetical protein TNCT_68751 [Trichonephila clavata]